MSTSQFLTHIPTKTTSTVIISIATPPPLRENRDVLAHLQANKTEVYKANNAGDTFALLAAAYEATSEAQHKIIQSSLKNTEAWAKSVLVDVQLKEAARNVLHLVLKVSHARDFAMFLVGCPWGREMFTWNMIQHIASFKFVGV